MTDAHNRYEWRRLVNRDPFLTEATRRVLLELEGYANGDGTNARPGVRRIATSLRTESGKHGHISERTVRTALAEGVARDYIKLEKKAPRGRGNTLADTYGLIWPADTWEDFDTLRCSCAAEKPASRTAANSDGNTGNDDSPY